MWFFDWLSGYAEDAKTYFADIAIDVKNVPVLGEYLAYPFTLVSVSFSGLSSGFAQASTWSDGISADVSNLLADVSGIISYLNETIISTVNGLISSLNSLYTYAHTTLKGLVDGALTTIGNLSEYVYETLKGAVDAAISTAQTAYNYAYGWLTTTLTDAVHRLQAVYDRAFSVATGLALDVWTWITTNRLGAYLDLWRASLRTVVLSWITNSMAFLISKGFTALGNSWASFTTPFTWLLHRLLDLMITGAEGFALQAWALLEAVIEQLSQWEEK